MDLRKFAVKVKTKEAPKALELGDLLPFLQTCREQGVRVTYAGLALLAQTLGVAEDKGQQPGQAGSSLVSKLPVELQPYVCQAGGGYDDKAILSWEAEGLFLDQKFLRSIGRIPPDAILEAFWAWKASQPD